MDLIFIKETRLFSRVFSYFVAKLSRLSVIKNDKMIIGWNKLYESAIQPADYFCF